MFKSGDLVEFKQYIPRLRREPHRLLRFRLHPNLNNTFGIIIKQLSLEEIWFMDDLSESEKKEILKPENNCYLWFSQIEQTEFAMFQNELFLIHLSCKYDNKQEYWYT